MKQTKKNNSRNDRLKRTVTIPITSLEAFGLNWLASRDAAINKKQKPPTIDQVAQQCFAYDLRARLECWHKDAAWDPKLNELIDEAQW